MSRYRFKLTVLARLGIPRSISPDSALQPQPCTVICIDVHDRDYALHSVNNII